MRVEDVITDRIVSELKKGNIPWKKPWKGVCPKNLISKKGYQGINFFLLSMSEYESPYFLTYKQARDLGGNVKKGEKGCPIVYWKIMEEEDDKEGKVKVYPLLRYYTVFNSSQCEDIKLPEETKKEKLPSYEEVVSEYCRSIKISNYYDCASYSPKTDEIHMPSINSFENTRNYYCTLYHELVHSTGNSKRLHRFNDDDVSGLFGSESYSKEELLAELGSAFICAKVGIDNRQVKNSAGYIQSWLKALDNDKRFIISASSGAQKAVEFITKYPYSKPSLDNS